MKVTPSGAVAVASAAVGPVASALVSTGVVEGVVTMASLEGGLVEPLVRTPTAVTAYVVPGCSPLTMQLVGLVQVAVTQAPPPTGQAVTV